MIAFPHELGSCVSIEVYLAFYRSLELSIEKSVDVWLRVDAREEGRVGREQERDRKRGVRIYQKRSRAQG